MGYTKYTQDKLSLASSAGSVGFSDFPILHAALNDFCHCSIPLKIDHVTPPLTEAVPSDTLKYQKDGDLAESGTVCHFCMTWSHQA